MLVVAGRAAGTPFGGAFGRLPASPDDGAMGRTEPGTVGLALGGGAAADGPGFEGLRDCGDAAAPLASASDGVADFAADDAGLPDADPAAGRGFGDPPPTAGGTAVIAGGRGGATGLRGAAGVGAGAGVSCTWSASPCPAIPLPDMGGSSTCSPAANAARASAAASFCFCWSSDIRHLAHNRRKFADLSDFPHRSAVVGAIFSVRAPSA